MTKHVIRGLSAFALLVFIASGLENLSTVAQAQVFTEPAPAPRSKPQPQPRPRPKHQPTVRPTSTRQPAPQPVARPSTFNDPVAYCAANPDMDVPGATYRGPPVPEWIATALPMAARQQTASAGTASYNWRCMNRRVLACASSAGRNLCAMPSQEREPTPEMQQYCTGKRRGEIPGEVTGNTVPIWICSNGKPSISGYRAGLDQRGYLSEHWPDVTDLSPANMVGSISRAYVGRWIGQIEGKAFLFKIPFGIVVNIQGGRLNERVGTIEYHAMDIRRQIRLFCTSNLYLRQNAAGGLELWERFDRIAEGADGRCPSQERLTLQLKEGQAWAEWRKAADEKVRMSGWLRRAGQ